MESCSLTELIRPTAVAAFIEQTWGRAPCVYPQSLGESASGIMSLASFELMLATLNRAHEGWLQFARGGRTPIPPEMVDGQGMLDLRKIRDAFAGGETLYLTKAERLSASLMQLSRAVQIELAANGVRVREPVNAHVFLTPPRSQGFPAHRDEHASFVLQLDGSKEWTVYEPLPVCGPSCGVAPKAGGVEAATLESLENCTYRLRAGDVLYMPEWWPHQAKAGNQHSLHVTLRIFPLRWLDLMIDLCRDYPGLATALPAWSPCDPQALSSRLMNTLHSAAFGQWAPSRLGEFSQRHAVPDTALPDDGFRQVLELDRIDENTRLVAAAGATCAVFQTADESCVRFPGGTIRGPAAFRPVFEFVAGTVELRPADLPVLPDVVYDRVEVARRLVKDGLLRIADNMKHRSDG